MKTIVLFGPFLLLVSFAVESQGIAMEFDDECKPCRSPGVCLLVAIPARCSKRLRKAPEAQFPLQ